jgi:filamentous hemagglutinin
MTRPGSQGGCARREYRGPVRAQRHRLRAVALLVAQMLAQGGRLHAATTSAPLPAGTLPVAAANWVSSGRATAARSGQTLTINQASKQAILNWQQFNIAKGSTVNFMQTGSDAQVLNRIGDASPSVIQGALQANGRVYLINRNGIVFGQGAQVNVGALVASTLGIGDDVFLNGVLTAYAIGSAAFSGDTGAVLVEPGATISTPSGGQVWVFAPDIQHSGLIQTPDGQTLLAAGKKVYLSSSEDASMRGVKVELGSGGSVLNLGQIVAERGNITLAGLAVNQSGRLSATTTVSRNGSIWLQGVERPDVTTGLASPGSVTLAAGSVSEVLPETASTETSTDAQSFLSSQVKLTAHQISLQGTALIQAPAGTVSLDSSSGTSSGNSGARIYMDAGARIDVAGVQDVVLPMSRNFVLVRLTSNELADSALQKSGALLGKTVTVDLREGSTLADVSGAVASVAHTVAERSTVGGSVSFRSSGDVVLRQGSSVDVSGGSLAYAAGWGSASLLLSADGRLVSLSQASADQVYLGVADQSTVNHAKWGVSESFSTTRQRYNAAYVEGTDAGTVTVSAPAAALDGSLTARVLPGRYQRSAGTAPKGGKLVVTQASDADGFSAALRMAGAAAQLASSFDVGSVLPLERSATLTLDANALAHGGFTRWELSAAGSITLEAGVRLDLGLAGSLSLKQGAGYQGNIVLAGSVRAPGGSISLSSSGGSAVGDIVLASGASLDVAGLWTNDNPSLGPALTGQVATAGGSVSLQAARSLTLASGSSVDVSGGAWYSAAGKLTCGKAGSIVLAASRGKDGTGNQSDGPLLINGALRGYGVSQGGSLILRADGFALGRGPVRDGSDADSTASISGGSAVDTVLPLTFFSEGGFNSISLTAWDRDSVLLDSLAPVVRNWVLPADASRRVSSSGLASVARVGVLPQVQRQAVNLSLPLSELSAGAAIVTDVGGVVSVSGRSHMLIDGLIQAWGGSISLSLAGQLPTSQLLEDYDATQALWLGSQAVLDARGAALIGLDKLGRLTGTIKAGGSVSLAATNAVVVAQEGSRMDVSGALGTLDLPTANGRGYTAQVVGGNAGSISVSSNVGMVLAGSLQAQALAASSQGGSLSLNLLGPDSANVLAGPRSLQWQTTLPDWQQVLRFGQPMPAQQVVGEAVVSTDSIQAGAFDVLSFKSFDALSWQGDTRLQARRSITLDAPNLAPLAGALLHVQAPYVSLGNSDGQRQSASAAATGGDAILAVDAQTLDVYGHLSTQGLGTVALAATGDIRLQGVLDTTQEHNALNTAADEALIGSLETAANLSLRSTQLYPTTLSQFTLKVQGDDKGVTLAGTGQMAQTPLSAGGSLSITADHIEVSGTVRAPLGRIALNATHTLTLDAGATLSVSGAGLVIPFGYTEALSDWFYALDASLGDTTRVAITAPPGKSIALQGEQVLLKPGSTLDVTGGGDLLAWQWQKGSGGSTDVLAQAGTWAIVPSLGAATAPLDWQNLQGATLQAGDAVYLSGVAGLAAGTYTLLPAHYALLPGAYAIKLASGRSDMLASQNAVLANGSLLVAGQRVVSGTAISDARSAGFVLMPGALVRQSSQYVETSGNSFFITASGRPADAGRLSLMATQALQLDGKVKLEAAQGQRGDVDISAPRIEVVSSLSATPEAGLLQLDADTLSAWQARTLVIGGVRAAADSTGAQALRVGAASVMLSNDAQHPLHAQDVVLAATESVSVAEQASVWADAPTTAPAQTLSLNAITLGGDGAVLRVSSASADVSRTSTTSSGGSAGLGRLNIGVGAQVEAAFVHLDASGAVHLADAAQLVAPSLTVSSSQIQLGQAASGVSGLVLSAEQLARLDGSTQSLTLLAQQGITLAGDLDLGRDAAGQISLRHLTLDTPWLASLGGSAQMAAQTLGLQNSGAASTQVVAEGPGSLSLSAGTDLLIGPGQMAFSGLSLTQLSAGADVRFAGSGGLSVAGDVAVQSRRITASNGAVQALKAGGAVTLVGAGDNSVNSAFSSTTTAQAAGLGAQLSISGASLLSSALIDAAAGQISLSATGNLTLAAGSVTRADGADKAFYDVTSSSPAGTIKLSSDTAQVQVRAGALLSVSGSEAGGDAGRLQISAAAGQLALDDGAQLAGQAKGAGRSAVFTLDVARLDDTGQLNDALNAGGFGAERSVRVRQGDVLIGASQNWRANSLSLSADAGRITVAGALLAQGAGAGQISLWAGGGLVLDAGASLVAQGRAQAAGVVSLGNTSTDAERSMVLAAGARIDVSSADAGGAAGEVRLRVARTGVDSTHSGGSDVALSLVAANVLGAEHIAIEAVQTYTGISSVDTAAGNGKLTEQRVATDTAAFMAQSEGILQRLGLAADSRAHLTPGVEVQSLGDLSLASDWSFYSVSRPGGEAGTLTLRAAGSLAIKANLSDGFDSAASTAALQSGASWSLRLVAGGDLLAADPLSVAQGGTGTFTLAAGKLIRTGTGQIDIASGHDVVLGSGASAIYTAGQVAPTLDGFTVPNGAVYGTGGGAVSVMALGNIRALSASTQDSSAWLYRYGSGAGSTSWWVSYKDFAQGIGTLGGGNVQLQAGGAISDVSAVVATSGRLAKGSSSALVQGGGQLSVQAGGAINGGVFVDMRGDASLQSGSSIGTGSLGLAPMLGLGDGQFTVLATGSAVLDGVFNPTLMTPGNKGVQGLNNSYLSTYAADSAISLSSLTGDAVLNNNTALALSKFKHQVFGQSSTWVASEQAVYAWYPGRVSVTAVEGNVRSKGMTLLPASQGGLSLMAGGAVTVLGTINESSLNPQNELASAAAPARLFGLLSTGVSAAAGSLLHEADAVPVRVYALSGDVTGPSTSLLGKFAEPVEVRAGGDLVNVGLSAQHFGQADVTLLDAAGDVRFTSPLNTSGGLATNNLGVTLAGPGTLSVMAGQDVNLGSSAGLLTSGNLSNNKLPDAGARIVVTVGMGRDAQGRLRQPDVAGLMARYVALETAIDPQAAEAYRLSLQGYLASIGQPGLSEAQALQAFGQLSLAQQLPFAAKLLYAELRASGRAELVSGKASAYQRGYAAIATLFPASDYRGDLRMYYSQIKTQRGGDISLMVPGGLVNEGLANPPARLSKMASQLGIVTLKGGSIEAMAQGDFLVNQSRTFTLGGGDILVWSSEGDINAGRGAKTTAYAPAPTLITKDNGTVEYDSSAAASGSGIGVLVTDVHVARGDIDLIAPHGAIDAGEAGIVASGDIYLPALQVIGSDNISVQGRAAGLPLVSAPAAGLSSLNSDADASKVAQQALDQLQTAAGQRSVAPSTFTVEVIGYGP